MNKCQICQKNIKEIEDLRTYDISGLCHTCHANAKTLKDYEERGKIR